MNVTLYPKLIDYIFQHCSHLQNADEEMANKTSCYYDLENMDKRQLAYSKAKGWLSDEPHIMAMTALGRENLKINIVNRIVKEHFTELELNLCPKCGKIARTPLAKQCRFCYHSWH